MSSEPKTIWIINQYASTLDSGFGGRHYYFAQELARRGYNVYLVSASYTHLLRSPPKVNRKFEVEDVSGFKFVWVRVPQYRQAQSKTRILNWFKFAWGVSRIPEAVASAPDVVLYSSPGLIGYLGARRVARRHGAKLIFEVRDLWPLTLIEIGGFSEKHWFIRFLQWLEDLAYAESDRVISNLSNSLEHMENRGLHRNKFGFLPTGYLASDMEGPGKPDKNILNRLDESKFLVGYVGTVGFSNALGTLVDAATILKDQLGIKFVVVGGGKERPALENKVLDAGLKNVEFIDPIPKVEVQALLARFDVLYLGWRDSRLYEYGIGANKIPEYLYSGVPVVHAFSGQGDLIHMSGAGLTVPAEDPVALSNAILEMYRMPAAERGRMGQAGRAWAEEHLEYKQLTARLVEVIEDDGR